jgi:hypothetical protein
MSSLGKRELAIWGPWPQVGKRLLGAPAETPIPCQAGFWAITE